MNNHQQFQFQQSALALNPTLTQPTQIPKTNPFPNSKSILSQSQQIGIDFDEHLNRIQSFYQHKIIRDSISKAVIGTFERKHLIQQAEFQLQKAQEDAAEESKAYADKIETWLNDSFTNSSALIEFQRYKQQKTNDRLAKINSIVGLIEAISQKIQNKKLHQIKTNFQASLQQKVLKIEDNNDYNRAMYKFKFIKQKAAARKKQLESKSYSQNLYL